jgi:hypothetical protein
LSFFAAYSPRAQRVIFWSLHHARAAGSGYIEPEHILEGLLQEDQQLFDLLAPEKPTLLENLKKELAAGRTKPVSPIQKVDMPLSPTGKAVVLAADTERTRFGHKVVNTQHLLLALLTACRKESGWFRKPAELPVQKLLAKHGVTAELVEGKTKNGIMTPTTRVVDDPAVALNAQLAALAELLIRKGLFTRFEFVALLDQHEGPLPAEAFLWPLMEAMERKGTISANEREQVAKLAKPGHAAEPVPSDDQKSEPSSSARETSSS